MPSPSDDDQARPSGQDTAGTRAGTLADLDARIAAAQARCPATPYEGCDHEMKCLTWGEHDRRVRALLRGPFGVPDAGHRWFGRDGDDLMA
jgi:hypothetical protein